MTPPPAVILAGGRARRMGGGDKALLPLGGRPILAHVIARLSPQVGAMALSANADPARFAGYDLPVLADSVPGRPGPLAGILAALDWAAARGAADVVTAASDTPFLPADLVARLRAAEPPPVLAATAGPDGEFSRHPTFGLWPVRLREDLRAALAAGVRRVTDWADRHGAGVALFPASDAFFNINTPADLAAAEAML